MTLPQAARKNALFWLEEAIDPSLSILQVKLNSFQIQFKLRRGTPYFMLAPEWGEGAIAPVDPMVGTALILVHVKVKVS